MFGVNFFINNLINNYFYSKIKLIQPFVWLCYFITKYTEYSCFLCVLHAQHVKNVVLSNELVSKLNLLKAY